MEIILGPRRKVTHKKQGKSWAFQSIDESMGDLCRGHRGVLWVTPASMRQAGDLCAPPGAPQACVRLQVTHIRPLPPECKFVKNGLGFGSKPQSLII